ncbi:hypothetical protein NDU88_005856 [Pleurodeles waltl]|uniref:Uncharacterized protein n=1 Tax=Pleurodeles waltl TaxID=8319 RepID=A0AAV7TWJ4_PLEWA|nr:hypothetical protein NDU88_005856 [Pleurodeles waltl]
MEAAAAVPLIGGTPAPLAKKEQFQAMVGELKQTKARMSSVVRPVEGDKQEAEVPHKEEAGAQSVDVSRHPMLVKRFGEST